jgi:hypothetical protein
MRRSPIRKWRQPLPLIRGVRPALLLLRVRGCRRPWLIFSVASRHAATIRRSVSIVHVHNACSPTLSIFASSNAGDLVTLSFRCSFMTDHAAPEMERQAAATAACSSAAVIWIAI